MHILRNWQLFHYLPERQRSAGAKNLGIYTQADTFAWKQIKISQNTLHKDNHGSVFFAKCTSSRNKFQHQTHLWSSWAFSHGVSRLLKHTCIWLHLGGNGSPTHCVVGRSYSCTRVILVALIVGTILLQLAGRRNAKGNVMSPSLSHLYMLSQQ